MTFRSRVVQCLLFAFAASFSVVAVASAVAQDRVSPLSEAGHVVDFQRDIAPIFATRCWECHQGDKAKADFRIDERDSVMQYVSEGDVEGSMLYADYLVTDDPDMLMPPTSHNGPLSAPQLALIRTWIQEGASWPDDATVAVAGEGDSAVETAEKGTEAPSQPTSMGGRVWAFQGYFHPATVHFPIALFSIGGVFVVLGVVWPKVGTQVPLACLLFGSIAAVAASAMGWSFATEQGYPDYTAGWDKEVTAHRWSGLIVTAAAVVLAVIAIQGVRKDNRNLNFIWKSGLLVLALLIGLVGHQGGEMTYPGLYEKAFAKLRGPENAVPASDAVETEAGSAENL